MQTSLYDPSFEHDNCGIGAVVNIKGLQTHETVDQALQIVEKLEHRAGKDADGATGDGVGIMLQISHSFFQKAAKECGITLGKARDYGVGMFFFPQDVLLRKQAMKLLEVICEQEGLQLLGWREVPVNADILGMRAKSCMPYIMQCFIKRPDSLPRGLAFDRRLYLLRRVFEQSNRNTYIPSLSSRTIVYKGMFLVHQLRHFYLDLQDPAYQSAIAMVHSRFSTNTTPSWERAHPNRFILHNGEINTIRGNADRMLAREETMQSSILSTDDMQKILPVISQEGSDSAMLDNTLEFLVMNGMPLPLAIMITIPEPWANDQNISRAKRDLYHYYATMMEPWDGPASILFSDGDIVGAVLDRNGLRPSRYYLTANGSLILASEVGVLDLPPESILQKSRLEPGKMLLIDTVHGKILSDHDIKHSFAAAQPYGEWLDAHLYYLKDLAVPNQKLPAITPAQRSRLYKAFGYTYEEVKTAILPMAQNGLEATAAMGTDIPLAVLSEKHQPLFNYFKQHFAQVTNPPLDSIREEIITDTTVYIGSGGNLLTEQPENCRALQIQNPILTSLDLLKIKTMQIAGFQTATISLLYYKTAPLNRVLEQLFIACDRAYRDGANILILSDRGVDENHVAIPSLLAVSAVEHHLIETKKRTAVSLILESGEPRDVHHFATLLGYGATAIHPYLAHECIIEMIDTGLLNKEYTAAIDAYNQAILHGIVKIAAKMGISTIQSYRGAQVFEAIGLSQSVIQKYFTNTISRVGGIGLEEIQEGAEWYHSTAFDPLGLSTDPALDAPGMHKLRSNAKGEDHMYSPAAITLLRQSCQLGRYDLFKQYTALINDENHPHTLRGLLEFTFDPNGGIPLSEVEPVSEIVKHFKTGAMSYGSLSQEAHECLAQAMNQLGGKSNSGEGGEAPSRLHTNKNSAIKQVASGRFGVTSEYLVSAKEIQIKLAQGAKPGEGGHLPGKKVYPWIAKTRYSTPGVALISPPPHHDIYSIEDLAQLIYDLKNANPAADISVKLVYEAGVGTIASGVAKGGAQVILISGYDGGTGAAPHSSIHNAGLPWELGLAETHQTLLQNGLRSRVRLETDGKLMTGRDVVIACMLGAEEFGFATAPLVTMGCVMMRVCNLDTCPAGIATQNPDLRKRFKGKPEYIVNFMTYIAQEMRELMAKLGIRTIRELVGRSDLLQMRKTQPTKRAASLDLSSLLSSAPGNTCFQSEDQYDFQLEHTLDQKILLHKLASSLSKATPKTLKVKVTSTDRSFGTTLGSEITRLHGNSLPEDTYIIRCSGGGGQSFGAFIPKGETLELTGDANDYFGKGLSGGKLIVYPPHHSLFKPEENIIIGNVALYGATSGKAFINGIAGERFAVRNSGALAVVEGVGDHGCEYMTGGRIVILGRTGKNFAAGMSGGVAYVLDEDHDLYLRVNKTLVAVEMLQDSSDIEELHQILLEHVSATHSPRAEQILSNFKAYIEKFKKVIPHDYQKMLQTTAQLRAQGKSHEQAQLEAFYAVTQK